MTPDDVGVRVEKLRLAWLTSGDAEIAHLVEDQIRDDVLRAIANGADAPAALARRALETGKISFSRWCA